MKIALTTDEHFGVSGGSQIFLDHQKRFFEDVFFPYLIENQITTVISLGDVFHDRKQINYNVLTQIKKFYFNRLEELGIQLYVIVGNHDIYHKHSNEINAYEALFSVSNNVIYIDEPEVRTFGECSFLFLPWITRSNMVECRRSIQENTCDYLLGHFEVSGIKLHRNWEFEDGLNYDDLRKFKAVWSGHYHLRLQNGNFRYLGTPYQMDWTDLYERKGFHIFDTTTEKLQFIENPYKLFYRIVWNGTEYDIENGFVKVVLEEQLSDNSVFDAYIKCLSERNHKVIIDEQYITKARDLEIGDDVQVEDTFDFLKKAIYKIEDIDNDGLERIMKNLYIEAKETEKL